MARTCEVCGRGSLKSKTRSHSNIGTIRRQKVNLQSLLVKGKRLQACAGCIRTATKHLREAAKKQTKA